ncbi:FAD-dependent oxidoreductase [Chitinophaga pendula]|uniref:NAD(P)/FAD-dependent oxidoreductase n=1 Tax=Chitinophaga TaxID=79328 RepID=UPI000BAEA98C|nr:MULTISPECIES: FAD-dependent oxidoreductase [Chitinophaga]ASZ14239.1 amino acid dehydrogenase [Chitinophaga sp. MD30]UCJ08117.1 FAD-dependent oxidoreductase [Chitinophaga pendula]
MQAVIIGGGIIGLSSAYYLRESGWEVTVIDSGNMQDNCSFGNMGMIVPSHFVPLAAPGIVQQGIRWMFNSRSPFYVKPRFSRALLSWGWQFMRSATREHVVKSAVPLRDINLLSKSLYAQWGSAEWMNAGLTHRGILMYYRTPEVAEEEAHLAATARQMGLDVQVLNSRELQLLEPEVAMDVLGAVHYRCDAHLYPNAMMQQLYRQLTVMGVRFVPQQAVTAIKHAGRAIQAVVGGQQTYTADLFVLAAGSWSPALAEMTGIRIPLMAGKGYSFTQNMPAKLLQVPAILCEARVAITPMQGHMRYGGTMELAGINPQVNMKRVEGIVRAVQQYLPGLEVGMPAQEQVWHGFRPCSPDGLPYIGYTKRYNNLLMATGHAMMGMSLGPATGKLIAELAMEQPGSVDIRAFDPDRFG